MKTVLTYGTFDLLHYGHVNLLRRAKELGDRLIVGLSTDECVRSKNKKTILSYEERKAVLEAIRYVDFVFPEENVFGDDKPNEIKLYNVDVFVIGDDWKGRFDYLKEYGVEVVYLSRTPNISTTQIKQCLNSQKTS